MQFDDDAPNGPVVDIVENRPTEIVPAQPWVSRGGFVSETPLTDDKIVALWLRRYESENTVRSYKPKIKAFRAAVGSLQRLTIEKMFSWAESLQGSPATRSANVATVKSLLRFAADMRYIPFDFGRPLKQPKRKDTLAERILTKEQALSIIEAAKGHRRNHALLRVLYSTGCRVSELVGLCWRDVQDRGGGRVQLTLFGKGGKTRHVLIFNQETCAALLSLRHGRCDTDAVFESRTWGGRLDRVNVDRLIKKYAKLAGVAGKVSAHWFRHAHASHSLDAGAPIHEVQHTLGHADLSSTSRYVHVRPDHSSSRFIAV
jgi:integrase/recombinase XerD